MLSCHLAAQLQWQSLADLQPSHLRQTEVTTKISLRKFQFKLVQKCFKFHFQLHKFLIVCTKCPLLRQQTDISCVWLRTFKFTCACGICLAEQCCRTRAFGEAKKWWTMIGENGDKMLHQLLKCRSSKPVLLFINKVQWRHSEILQQTIVPVPCQFSAVPYKK